MEGDKLVNHWLAELLVDVNFYASNQNLAGEITGELKALNRFIEVPFVSVLRQSEFREMSKNWEAQTERRFMTTLTVSAQLSQVISECETAIEKVNFESNLTGGNNE